MPPNITRLPLEVFDTITLQLTALELLGPPAAVVPLMQTSKAMHALLVPEGNPGLYARIFRQKFDSAAVARRAFHPSQTQCADQLWQYLAALRFFRRGELRITTAPGEELPDIDVEGALITGIVMMLEDDGKNALQLVHWGHADAFVDRLVRQRLYEGAEQNHGWPLENGINSHALWLMWLLTTEESLLKESPTQRAQLLQLLLPFIHVPFRYPTALAPPTHYLLPPLTSTPTSLPSTIPTPHGPYPVYPTPAITSIVHYSSRPQLSRPNAALAARLLYFAREECTPMPVPPHLVRTRAEREAAGVWEVGPTREDVEEWNWGWTARLPGGRAWARSQAILDDADEEIPSRPAGRVFPGFVTPPPILRWVGKAPHLPVGKGKSRRWDVDWTRLRMCGDLMKMPPRVPYGRVHEPGSLDGLWHGRMLVPGEEDIQALMNDPHHPPHGAFMHALNSAPYALFVRLQELHGVVGEVVSPPSTAPAQADDEDEWVDEDEDVAVPFALGSQDAYDGMQNGWFKGSRAPRLSPLSTSEEKVHLDVGGERGVYRCWKARERAERRGNMAFEGREEGKQEEEGEWEGYEHDQEACAACTERAEFRRRLRLRRRRRSNSQSSDSGSESDDGEDELMDPWDANDALPGPPGPFLPPTHDQARRAQGPCSGLSEIVVVGSPDPAHAAAFHPFEWHGRIRPWDGLILLKRTPKRRDDGWSGLGETLFYGYLVGRDTFVGNWRVASADPGGVGWEGAFCLGRRVD